MTPPDLAKIRRFSLAVSLILLVYSFTGIDIDTTKELKFLDVPISLKQPKLVPWALILATFYGAFQYWFYGMRRLSTWRIRKDIQDSFTKEGDRLTYNVGTRDDVLWWIERIQHAYAGVADGDSHTEKDDSWTLWIKLPPRLTLATRLRDIDYSAPFWFSMFALLVAFWRLTLF